MARGGRSRRPPPPSAPSTATRAAACSWRRAAGSCSASTPMLASWQCCCKGMVPPKRPWREVPWPGLASWPASRATHHATSRPPPATTRRSACGRSARIRWSRCARCRRPRAPSPFPLMGACLPSDWRQGACYSSTRQHSEPPTRRRSRASVRWGHRLRRCPRRPPPRQTCPEAPSPSSAGRPTARSLPPRPLTRASTSTRRPPPPLAGLAAPSASACAPATQRPCCSSIGPRSRCFLRPRPARRARP
mmetsp:Transcript_11367/g.35052  ORF Transcript_11367/g.35052 Transcript_11367/m.35052 type:complete len:248 (-) Transcript_11367:668-1411(-)